VRGQYINLYVNEKRAILELTIGYVADENGFQPFLISASLSKPKLRFGGTGYKSGISSNVLGSLVGGNIG
jgi:hypothetical protein